MTSNAGRGVHLISMPWHALGLAPLALALLRETLSGSHQGIPVTEHFGNLRWAEYLMTMTDGRLRPRHYHHVADDGIPLGLGDWVFAGALYGDPDWRVAELREFAARQGVEVATAMEMRALADGFIEMLATEIAAAEPLIAGFTTTFMQNLPSLALARRIKEKAPSTVIVFGGANCDGLMGAAVHRNFPFVDYVVRGEAELVFPPLLDAILASEPAAGLDGVCWRQEGRSVANPQVHPAVPAASIPDVSYDAWHDAFTASPVREYVLPWLVVEGSRGCWWGERHHCVFCGLNDATLGFRGKPAERVWAEMRRLIERYRILDVITSDNIMSVGYFRELLPLMARSGWDVRVHFEMKANVTEEQIRLLAQAGVPMVQFGIENLSSKVLRIMDKGLDGATAVRVLRDAVDHGVSVAWNYLYGFPGEQEADYRSVIAQLPALVHLQPPVEPGACRIELERFSPYFERPELGFATRSPAAFYAHIYDLPADELQDIAYYFDCPDHGISGDAEEALNKALARWSEGFQASSLCVTHRDDELLVLDDRREGWPRRTISLSGWQRAAYDLLRLPRRAESLGQRMAAAGTACGTGELGTWLAEMRERGLVFCDDGRWVALATERAHAKLPAG